MGLTWAAGWTIVRGISPEQMVVAMDDGGLLDILEHPNLAKYPKQKVLVVAFEDEILAAYDKGALKSVATKAELSKVRAIARATAIKDRRVNIRLSAGDLHDIEVRALEEGLPCQTLIASVLHLR